MSKTQELKEQLKKAEAEEIKEKWEIYLSKLKGFLDSLKGQYLLRWHSSGSLTMFLVNGYQEHYYSDRQGAYGQWGPERWFELSTTGRIYLSLHSSKELKEDNFYQVEFIRKTKKYKDTNEYLQIPYLRYEDVQWSLRDDFGKIGFIEYDENPKDPNHEQTVYDFTCFTKIISKEVYDTAFKIVRANTHATIDYWKKYESIINNAPRLEFKQ